MSRRAHAWNWSSIRLRRGNGVVEMDAVPVASGNENVVTRGMFKLAAGTPGTFAVLDVEEAKVVRDRLSSWVAAKEKRPEARIHPRCGKGVVEIDAVTLDETLKLAAHGGEPGTFAVLDVKEAEVVRDRLSAWIAAKENK